MDCQSYDSKKIELDNIACEKVLMKKMGTPDDTPITKEMIQDIPIQIFEHPNATLLSAFIKIRELSDLTKSLYIPNKGTLQEVLNGHKDKKGGPLLIEYAFDTRGKDKIGLIPDADPNVTSTPDILHPPPTVRRFVDLNLNVETESIVYEWCHSAKNIIQCLVSQSNNHSKSRIQDHMDKFNSHVDELVKKIIVRLKKYVALRIPAERRDLMPGKHWVWSSFASKLKRIAALMVLSYHVTDYDDLLTRSEEEDLFSKEMFFSCVDDVIANTLSSDYDGNYLCMDSRRTVIIRSGAANSGMKKRWKQHLTSSMLNNEKDKKSRFYQSYPNKNCNENNLPSQSLIKGNFQQVKQLMGIGFTKRNLSKVVELFEWNTTEEEHLKNLSVNNKGMSMEEKKYRHLCYLCELAYGICIAPKYNISSNPGCEWQLRYYGTGI